MANKSSRGRLDFISDDYLKDVREKLKAMKAKPGRSREKALKYLEREITRLLKSGYSSKEIMETVNEGQVVVSNSDIKQIISKIVSSRASPPKPPAAEHTEETESMRRDSNDGDGTDGAYDDREQLG